jgi:hypothetical protein
MQGQEYLLTTYATAHLQEESIRKEAGKQTEETGESAQVSNYPQLKSRISISSFLIE